jgi:hypothetical protein
MVIPSLDRRAEDRWKVLVVGQGLCGAKISAAFSDPPSFLPVVTEDLYPMRSYVFDTDGAIKTMLVQQAGWHPDWADQRCFIVPSLSEEEVFGLFFADMASSERDPLLRLFGGAGIGGHPVLGRESAKKYLADTIFGWKPVRDKLDADLSPRGYGAGGLLTINSLTGGTGSGFVPLITEVMSREVMTNPRLVLNLSIIPDADQMSTQYPLSILCTLHYLMKSPVLAGTFLVDNGSMRRNFSCRNLDETNQAIREILAPMLLAPLGSYDAPGFGMHLDGANFRLWLKRNFLLPDLCALGSATSPVPGRFSHQHPGAYLDDLLSRALRQTTVDIDTEALRPYAAVGVLSGPPEFYRSFLRKDSKYYGHLHSRLGGCVAPTQMPGEVRPEGKRTLAFLEFEGMNQVRLSVALAGVLPWRLISEGKGKSRETRGILEQALGTDIDLHEDQTLADWLRALNSEQIEELFKNEVRANLHKLPTFLN